MATTARPMQAEDLYLLRQLHGCQLSPDGSQLVTAIDGISKTQNKKYVNLYLQPTRGGALKQFTRGEYLDVSPRFSPDGRSIAFLSNRSGRRQVHLIRVDGGESWQLTKLEGDVHDFVWAPDGRSLCVVFLPLDEEARQREKKRKAGQTAPEAPKVRHVTRFHYKAEGTGYLPETKSELHLVNARTGRSRLLFKDDYHNGEPVFTPDGRHVIFVSNKRPDHELEPMLLDLWKVRADGKGQLVKLETHAGPVWTPSVSPDGKWLAFNGWADAKRFWNEVNSELFVMPLAGGKPRSLSAELDRSVINLSLNDTWGIPPSGPPQWGADSRELYSVVTTEGSTEIYRFDAGGGGGAPVFAEPGVVLEFAVDSAKNKLYCAFSDLETPGDLFGTSLAGGKLKRLTRVNSRWLDRRELGSVEEIWVRGRGGHRIQGWVMTPPGFNRRRKYPAILYIHGGPHVAYARAIFHEFNYLAGLGYVVFFCNPRGSHGYGKEFVGAIAEGWGGKDYEDVMKFTDHVLKHYSFIDPGRVGVTGGSYGGYMTNWIIGHTRRFKAAVTQRSVSNLLSFMATSDGGYHIQHEFRSRDKTPWQDRERYLQMSPMTHIVKAKTPTLVIHSEADLRAPIEQGEQVYVQLKLQGVETELVRFPEESHELSRGGRTDRRIERLKRISGWFDKYLKPAPNKRRVKR